MDLTPGYQPWQQGLAGTRGWASILGGRGVGFEQTSLNQGQQEWEGFVIGTFPCLFVPNSPLEVLILLGRFLEDSRISFSPTVTSGKALNFLFTLRHK